LSERQQSARERFLAAIRFAKGAMANPEVKKLYEPRAVAKALKVPVESVKHFDEEKAIFAIQNNYDNSIAHSNFQFQPNFNPLAKYVEAVEGFKSLNEDNRNLYLALLKEKDEKISLLEKLVAVE
jgi:hypothetical protein